METHSSILGKEILWTQEPGRLQSITKRLYTRKSCGHRSLAGYSPSQKGCTLLNCWAHCRLVWVSIQLHCYLIHFIYVFTLRVITLLLYCRVHTLPKAVVFVFIFTVCPLYFSIFSWPSSFLYLSFGLPSFLPIFRTPSSNLYF